MYNAFELSAYVAFDSLLTLEDQLAWQTKQDPDAFTKTESPLNETKILEEKIETACFHHKYSEDYYPIVFGFARGITRVFYTTPLNSEAIITDIVEQREPSDVLAEMKREQLLFLKQSKDFLQYTKKHMLNMEISLLFGVERKSKLAAEIFSNSKSSMTSTEYGLLKTLGNSADKIKKAPPTLLIKPYGNVG